MSELITQKDNPIHFETFHANDGETMVCLGDSNDCQIGVEIDAGYDQDEIQQLIESTKIALDTVDQYTEGKAGEIFGGLQVKISEGDTIGGGQAEADVNQIVLNGRKMLLSIAQMRQASGAYSEDELSSFPDQHKPGGALEYTLVHEMGHVLDGQTQAGVPYHRVPANESPTQYGQKPDQWNSQNKDHEAFAEGFAHAVYGMPISQVMEDALQETISSRIKELG